MAAPLITTIIPTFRRPGLLKRAIESVLCQTFRDFQVCIYDNASGDETASVVAEFARQDPRIKYHCHAQNIGAGANFNYGLARVDTPYFSFLSDDDILLPEFYETALAGFDSFPDAGFFAGSTIVMNDAGEILTVPLDLWPREGYFAPPDGLLQLINSKLPVWTSILFRKAVTDQVGAVDHEVGAPGDFDYQLKVASRSPLVVSRRPCAIFVSHDDSFSAKPSIAPFWPGWRKLAANIMENPDIPESTRIEARRGLTLYIKKTLFSIGLKLIRARDFADARQAAAVLRLHFGETIRPFVLASTAKVCASSEVPSRCFVSAYDFAQSLRRTFSRDRVRLQEKYGEYAKWL